MTNEFRGIRDDDESHTHSLTTQTYRFASTSTSSSSSRSFNARVARPVRSRSRPRSRARPPSRCQTVVPRGGSIADRNSTRSNPTSRSVGNRTDVEPNRRRTEPNRRRTERDGPSAAVSPVRARDHSSIIRAFSHSFIPFVDANGRARDDDTTKNSHQIDVSCVKYDTSSRDRCMCVSREAC